MSAANRTPDAGKRVRCRDDKQNGKWNNDRNTVQYCISKKLLWGVSCGARHLMCLFVFVCVYVCREGGEGVSSFRLLSSGICLMVMVMMMKWCVCFLLAATLYPKDTPLRPRKCQNCCPPKEETGGSSKGPQWGGGGCWFSRVAHVISKQNTRCRQKGKVQRYCKQNGEWNNYRLKYSAISQKATAVLYVLYIWSLTSYLSLFVFVGVCMCVWGGGGGELVYTVVLTLYLLACMFDGGCDGGKTVYFFSCQPRYSQKTPHSGPGSVKTAAHPKRKRAAATRGPSEVEGGADYGGEWESVWETCCKTAIWYLSTGNVTHMLSACPWGWPPSLPGRYCMSGYEGMNFFPWVWRNSREFQNQWTLVWESLQHCWIVDGNHGGNFLLSLWTVLVLGTFYGYPSVSVLWRLTTSSYSCAIAKRTLGAVLTAEPVFRQGVRLRLSSLVNSQPSQNQVVIGWLSRLLEMFDRLLSKGPIAFSCIQESLSLLLPTNNLLFKIFLRRLTLTQMGILAWIITCTKSQILHTL